MFLSLFTGFMFLLGKKAEPIPGDVIPGELDG
jgi:hypothetical protein